MEILFLLDQNDDTAWLWDVKTGTLLQDLKGISDSISSVAFSPDGNTVLRGSDDKKACLYRRRLEWNKKTKELLLTYYSLLHPSKAI